MVGSRGMGNKVFSGEASVKVGDETVEQLDEEGVAKELAPRWLLREAILCGVSALREAILCGVRRCGKVVRCSNERTSLSTPQWLQKF